MVRKKNNKMTMEEWVMTVVALLFALPLWFCIITSLINGDLIR